MKRKQGISLAEFFGQNLIKLRQSRGLSQAELATKANMHSTAISHFEAGRREPMAGSIMALAHALEVQPEDLLPRCGRPKT